MATPPPCGSAARQVVPDMTKMNGTGMNGGGHHDPEEDFEETERGNVTPFPPGGKRPEPEEPAGPPQKYEPVFNLPPVTKALCLILLAIQLAVQLMPDDMADGFLTSFSFIPARYSGVMPFDIYAVITPVTYMFLHGGWLHVGVNVGMLVAFGTGVERYIGTRRGIVLFFAAGIIGAFVHALLNLDSTMPLVGASGGISGLFGALMMMAYARGMLGGGYRKFMPFVAILLSLVLVGYFGVPGESNGIAWMTHVGGFITGLLLYRPVMRLPEK
ncbi:MAG: rhomboid family intramembrane serine protease [Alphaproteobacteria bacterium]|nr:rhomboid family intramembrane serine protease [Alphaproteobacteria bacterium]